MKSEAPRRITGPLPAIAAADAEKQDRYEQQSQQYDGNGGRDRPVAIGEKLSPQCLPDHQRFRAAKQVGNDEFTDNRNEAEQRAR